MLVAGFVASNFNEPIGGVGFWDAVSATAGVAVPEATMNEDDLVTRWKNEIGASWQLAAMKSETIAKSVNEATDKYFRGGVD